jgi:hypothetical protein
VRYWIGAEDRNFGVGDSFGVERRTFTRPPVKPIGLLADISLPTPTIDFLDDPNELHRSPRNVAGSRNDLCSLDSFVPVYPKVEDAACRFMVRRRRHTTQWYGASHSRLSQVFRRFGFSEFSH